MLKQGRLTDSTGHVTTLLMEAHTQWAHPEPGRRQTWGWVLSGDPRYGRHEHLRLELPDGTIAQGPGRLDVTRGRARYDHVKIYLDEQVPQQADGNPPCIHSTTPPGGLMDPQTTPRPLLATGQATRPGTTAPSGDAAAVHRQADGTAAAAVVDGIGHSPRVAAVAHMLAEVAARVAARRGPLAGLLTGVDLVADPGAGEEPEPDAVAVVAVAEPGDDRVRIAWVGDARAYALEDGQLRPLTTDHNLAEQLTMCGYAGEVTRRAAQWVRTTVATAAVATVAEAWTDAPLVLLTSDGVHDQVSHDELDALVRTLADDPQALADALVAAARADADGCRDDATVVVLARPAE